MLSTIFFKILIPSIILGSFTYFISPFLYDLYLIISYGSEYYPEFKTASIKKFTIGKLEVRRGDSIGIYIPSEFNIKIKNFIEGTIIGKTPDEDVIFIKTTKGDVIVYSIWAITSHDFLYLRRKSFGLYREIEKSM